jgi:alkylhydroperoxidase family enzyme
MEYAHGGLTVQEALIPSLTVTAKHTASAKAVVVKELKWAQLRLNLILEGAQGLTVDVRSKIADAGSSFVTSPAKVAGNGQKTSLLVADNDALGTAAFLVLLDEKGEVIHKRSVVIGEG